MDDTSPSAKTAAVQGGKILTIRKSKAIRQLAGYQKKTVDLTGKASCSKGLLCTATFPSLP